MTYEISEDDGMLRCLMCGHISNQLPRLSGGIECPQCHIIHSDLDPEFIRELNGTSARTPIDQDQTVWAKEQWAFLSQRKFGELDTVTLVDEFDVLVQYEWKDVDRTIRRLLWNLMKLRYALGYNALEGIALCDLYADYYSRTPPWQDHPNSMRHYWWAQQATQAAEWLARLIKASPSLEQKVSGAVAMEWRSLKLHGKIEWALGDGELPAECPWTVEEIRGCGSPRISEKGN